MTKIHMYKDNKSIYLSFEDEECCEDYAEHINEKIDNEANWSIKTDEDEKN